MVVVLPSALIIFDCRRGGLVVQHHNEIRDAIIGDLMPLAWGQVRHETVVVEAEDQHDETLIADLCVCRV